MKFWKFGYYIFWLLVSCNFMYGAEKIERYSFSVGGGFGMAGIMQSDVPTSLIYGSHWTLAFSSERFFTEQISLAFQVSGAIRQKGYSVSYKNTNPRVILTYALLEPAIYSRVYFQKNYFAQLGTGIFYGTRIKLSTYDTTISKETLESRYNKTDAGFLFHFFVGRKLFSSFYLLAGLEAEYSWTDVLTTKVEDYQNYSWNFTIKAEVFFL
ncbi:MAG: hypothetical protein D6767_04605 [Candidatus Hydrogenedentota bacterium]|nr:MAG: hypothetical protein D6767_04605 [Candidatus Hydrogenedentota bacterium]